MADNPTADDEVRILPPDKSLLKKLGNINLDQIFSTQIVEAAQKVIVDSSDTLFAETLASGNQLHELATRLRAAPEKAATVIPGIIAASFSMKSSASLAGYDLVAALAKSLHEVSEAAVSDTSPTMAQIILWHLDSLQKITTLKLKGSGGAAGEAILKELDNIKKLFAKDNSRLVPTA